MKKGRFFLWLTSGSTKYLEENEGGEKKEEEEE